MFRRREGWKEGGGPRKSLAYPFQGLKLQVSTGGSVPPLRDPKALQ